jgi:hypothetical protein
MELCVQDVAPLVLHAPNVTENRNNIPMVYCILILQF